MIGTIFGKYMTKDEVITIDVEKYSSDTKCPDYSPGFENMNFCRFEFFCRGNECSSVNSTTTETILFTNKDGKAETLIPKYCTESSIKEGNCTTSACSKDADCLTNKCEKGICVENKSLNVEVCMDSYEYSFTGNQKTVMHCGKNNGESCSSNKECASNECNDNEKICVRQYHDNHFNGLDFYVIVIIGIIVLIAIACLVLCWCCCC
jgi:hypothetical protein